MQSYLMAQGQWLVVVDSPVVLDEEGTNAAAVKEYNSENNKAMGNIRLRVTSTIRESKLKSLDTAKKMWDTLKTAYGQPGLATVYKEFRAALETEIPSNTHPQPALDKMQAHFDRLTDLECSFPAYVEAMILLSKLPPSMDALAHIINQASSSDGVKELKPDNVRRMIVLHWEQRTSRKGSHGNGGNANKLSAVKRKLPEVNAIHPARCDAERPRSAGTCLIGSVYSPSIIPSI